MGVLSFNPRREGRFVIPRYCLVQLRGGRTFRGFTRWNNEVVAPLRNPINTDFPVVRDGGVRISERIPLQPYAWWEQRVRQTLRLIDAGLLVKLVLARSLELRTTGLVSPGGLFVKLGRSHPGIYSYCFRISDRECFVGAIPELLVERTGQLVRSRPFAGTVPLSSFSHPRAAVRHLMENNKIAREHSITLHHVRDALLNYSSGVVTSQPSAVQLATVAHLASSVECRLPPSSTVSSLDLAYSLHPTPAVAGFPTQRAVAWIKVLEECDRREYAGPVGWMDASGDGEWTLGLRSAHVVAGRLTLRAGAGLVAGSDPSSEWDETEAKLATIPELIGFAGT
ncbi:isochorismate synthase MenF [Streptomyces sp. NBC_01547]|uniref:isochorismate synthase n=1 Tax=Streptomyces sp. NBC_01547 TaxID=2975873 RepID=UPI00386E8EAB